MIIIDEPYISEFLADTIQRNEYEILDTTKARKLMGHREANWIDESSAIKKLQQEPYTSVYSNSENALSWLADNLPNHTLTSQIPIFKDKNKFRGYIKSLFPDFVYHTVLLEDIQSLSIDNLSMPFVIKPTIGFFSIGVHIIKSELDWNQAKEALQVDKLQSMFPTHVLNTSTFIIEEYIEGEEYAIDYYYDQNGEAVVLNVLHHLFSSGTDTSDRVYTTSKAIITEHATRLEDFLTLLGKPLKLKNFPAHAEVRIDKDGKIVPIEINPLRFGGWCTTGDVLGIGLDFNSYECFFKNERPNWDLIFAGNEDKLYSIVILNNSTGVDPLYIKSFNYERLSADFENPLLLRELDIDKYPAFGFLFTESHIANEQELYDILVSDLKKYVTLKPISQ